jgi:DNA-binding NtrC family response regulator
VEDRVGWMESCPRLGTIFLDEIGEVSTEIQVKLLRVIQTRCFSRIGESKPRTFMGKIVAATNRDLAAEMKLGRFREDFYYRLCSDLIITPSLQEQLKAEPGDLRNLLSFICQRIVADDADELAREVEHWITQNVGREYAWPGNFRELEQCARNILIRREYRTAEAPADVSASDLAALMDTGSLSADDLIKRYAKLVYSKNGSYEETARKLNLDRRTVKAKVTT